MRFHIAAPAFAAACLVTGCGFTPKQPPKPVDGPRVPVNQAPPFPLTSPWQLPVMTPLPQLNGASAQLVADAALLQQNAKQESTTSTPAAEAASLDPSSKNDHPKPDLATEFIWPVTLPFQQTAPILTTSSQDKWSFHWPPIEASMAAQDDGPTIEGPSTNLPEREKAQTFAVPKLSVQMGEEFDVKAPLLSATDIAMAAQVDPEESSQPESSVTPPEPTSGRPSPSDIRPPAEAQTPETAANDPMQSQQLLEAPLEMWTASMGSTLSDLLREWAVREGWTVRWETAFDFVLEAPFSIEASDFLAAAERILTAYRRSGYELYAVAYSNKVLLIKNTKD